MVGGSLFNALYTQTKQLESLTIRLDFHTRVPNYPSGEFFETIEPHVHVIILSVICIVAITKIVNKIRTKIL